MRSASVAVVVGTRPEAVKLEPVVVALGDRAFVVHTGQHYDAEMWGSVIADLGLPPPEVSVTVGGLTRGEQIGEATSGITRMITERDPDAIVVLGDTNSTLAGALAGHATGRLVVHVEAGLRSGDLSMPEEGNRLLTDRIADVCCAPIEANAQILRHEGVREERIVVTGNTLMEAMRHRVPDIDARAGVRRRLGVPDDYVLCTMHRAGTVDDRDRLRAMLEGIGALARRTSVVVPIHPHTRRRVDDFGLQGLLAGVVTIDPVVPGDFLALEAGASMIASDSGGVQEEAVLVRRPLVILRDSTERPELLGRWSDLLGDREPQDVLVSSWERAEAWRADLAEAPMPYGEADAAPLVVEAMDRALQARRGA